MLLAASLATVHGQDIPEAPKPQPDRMEWSLLAIDASSRALDVYMTRYSLTHGGREIFLPPFIVNHASTMAAYSAGAIALDWLVARRLERHGHRKLAHTLTMLDIGQDPPGAIANLLPHNRVKLP